MNRQSGHRPQHVAPGPGRNAFPKSERSKYIRPGSVDFPAVAAAVRFRGPPEFPCGANGWEAFHSIVVAVRSGSSYRLNCPGRLLAGSTASEAGTGIAVGHPLRASELEGDMGLLRTGLGRFAVAALALLGAVRHRFPHLPPGAWRL